MGNVKIIEYIWLDSHGKLYSKTRVLAGDTNYSINNIPVWHFTGSSTGQSSTQNNDLILKPVNMYENPFCKDSYTGYLVICEVYIQNEFDVLKSHQGNSRFQALDYFNYAEYYKPKFTFRQDYYLVDDSGKILNNDTSKNWYCKTSSIGRDFAESHMYSCLKAGLKFSGMNSEDGPGQWSYIIGPNEGIEAADQLIVSRFILLKLADLNGKNITLHPKPFSEFNDSSCTVLFSTIQMRMPNSELSKIMESFANTHEDYVKECGKDIEKRLTGENKSSMMTSFNWGLGNNTSIRVPMETAITKCGYLEDRRPNSNVDPYPIVGNIIKIIMDSLNNEKINGTI